MPRRVPNPLSQSNIRAHRPARRWTGVAGTRRYLATRPTPQATARTSRMATRDGRARGTRTTARSTRASSIRVFIVAGATGHADEYLRRVPDPVHRRWRGVHRRV